MSAVDPVLDRTIATLVDRLLAARAPDGSWEGRLSSSALSTATAVLALAIAGRARGENHDARIQAGVEWLVTHQHHDGGWGDTPISRSNVSTTLLVWAALSATCGRDGPPAVWSRRSSASAQATADHRSLWRRWLDRRIVSCSAGVAVALDRAESWLRAELGDLDPSRLRGGVLARYGKDRTFSVPILTVLALAGRLGEGEAAWRQVPQLPFELAVLPHRWFQWIRLPVVSYALPALIAIGQARHAHAPTRFAPLRALRRRLEGAALDVLGRMQPPGGGFLEATPLTSFVAMSLAAGGRADHPVVASAIRFLVASVRQDGSWPIDTHLSTWITTLATNALAGRPGAAEWRPAALADWLVAQQWRDEHPYTHASPGGWAWTPLAGGVPDADDTAGALLALSRVEARPDVEAAAARGIDWLLGLQNRDGGIPTFCRGWGALPFDRSAADLTAHAIAAWSRWRPRLDERRRARVDRAMAGALGYLARVQDGDGAWTPLWFGNEWAPGETNRTYGTARVLLGLASLGPDGRDAVQAMRQRGESWLLTSRDPSGGWGGDRGTPPSIEETGLALQALAQCTRPRETAALEDAMTRGAAWLVERTGEGRHTPAAPIGLYFARLWYYEELYPLIFATGGLLAAREWLASHATAADGPRRIS